MDNSNPYMTPEQHHRNRDAALESQFKARCALTGFLSGAVLPVGYGIYVFQHEAAHAATLAPGEAMCGSGGMLAMMMICVAGPVLGGIGAAAGWLIAKITRWMSW